MATETDQLTIESGHFLNLSDQDILIQYCLQNKVNKVTIDELLKRSFNSLEALKLVAMEDLSSQNISIGQRRLIHHIAQALKSDNAPWELDVFFFKKLDKLAIIYVIIINYDVLLHTYMSKHFSIIWFQVSKSLFLVLCYPCFATPSSFRTQSELGGVAP